MWHSHDATEVLMNLADGTRTTIARFAATALRWETLVRVAETRFGWLADTDVFVYSETARECTLDRMKLSSAVRGDHPLQGRLFNPAGEVRWVARPNAELDAWFHSEGAGSEATIRIEQAYFLLGRGTIAQGEFSEGRYTGKRFRYPVTPAGTRETSLTRAYVLVHEYYREEPQWDRYLDEEHETQINRGLNEPMLIAHRFVDVGIAS
jgi:hypothetical protein